jgi:gluconokinase
MLADVFGRQVSLPNISEGAAFGDALLGFVPAGALQSIADTGNLNVAQSFQPQPQAAARYGRLQVYWNLQQVFSEISAYQAEHTH